MRLIEEICRGLRIGLTTHTPSQVWAGNEVQKRNHAVRLAEAVTREDGWYYVHDADTVVTSVAYDWFTQLEKIRDDDWGVISVGVRESQNLPIQVVVEEAHAPVRLLYRALRGLQYGPTHWTLRAPDPLTGEPICFWGDTGYEPVAAFDGTFLLKLDHRRERPEQRRVQARQYYDRRERFGIEQGSVPMIMHTDGQIRPATRGDSIST